MEQRIRKSSREMNFINRWSFVALGMLIMLLLGTVYSYSVFRASLEMIFDIGSAESGMPYMTSLASYAVFMFLTGKYIEKFEPRKIILFGGIIVSLGWILSSFSSNILILTLTYGLIGGAGVGIVYGVPMTVVAKWFPEKKGLAVGIVLIGFGLSPLITAPLVRVLVEYAGVMKTFLILGIFFGISLPILSRAFRYPLDSELVHADNDVSNSKENKKDLVSLSARDVEMKDMIKTKSFKGLYVNFVIGTMIGLTLIGKTASIGVNYISLDPRQVAGMMSLFAIFNGLGRPTFGWLTDKINSKRAMLLSYSLIAIAAMLLVVFGENNSGIYMISLSIFWFNLGGWLAIAPTSTIRLYGMKNYSRNYGLVFTAYGVGAVVGVSTSGMIFDALNNYAFVFYYIIALCAVGALLTNYMISE